jgi:predicted dehydrogenase
MSIRVAVIGLGMMGTTHFKSYQEIPEARVVAVCDLEGRKLSGDWTETCSSRTVPGNPCALFPRKEVKK